MIAFWRITAWHILLIKIIQTVHFHGLGSGLHILSAFCCCTVRMCCVVVSLNQFLLHYHRTAPNENISELANVTHSKILPFL